MSGVTVHGETNIYADEVRRMNEHLEWLRTNANEDWRRQGILVLKTLAANHRQGMRLYYELFPDRRPAWR